MTTYFPATLPTNAPSRSMLPLPGEKLHVGVRPVIAWPRRSRTSSAKRTTSPCRALTRAGVTFTVTPVAGITWALIAPAAPPARAVIVAVPGATAVSMPSATRSTAGLELVQVTASSRASPDAVRTRCFYM